MSPSVLVRRDRRVRGLVVLASTLTLGLYFFFDGRLPRDPGLYWAELPPVWRSLQAGELGPAVTELGRPGGWLVVAMAALAHLGRGPWLMESLSLVSVATVVACGGRIGTHLSRDAPDPQWGGPTGALLAAGMPLVVVQARLPWIHLPEAALLGVLLVTLLEDPELRRPRSVIRAALAGAALASVRHSGLVWLATVAPLLRGRAWALLIPWTVGAVPSLAALGPYLAAKGAARTSYAARLPGLLQQLWVMGGALPLALVVLGTGARLRHRRLDRTALAGAGMLAATALMWGVFQAGMDNFTPVVFGLVLLAAGGASRGTVGLGVAAVAWVAVRTLLPVGPAGLRDLERSWRAPEVTVVRALVRASCGPGACRIASDSGLFHPYGEEPGRLELWLLGMDQVELVDLRNGARPLAADDVAGVAEWDCGPAGAPWMRRFPQSRAWQRPAERRLGLAPAWVFRPDPSCALVWWAPNGELSGRPPRRGRPPEGRPRAGRRGSGPPPGEPRGTATEADR